MNHTSLRSVARSLPRPSKYSPSTADPPAADHIGVSRIPTVAPGGRAADGRRRRTRLFTATRRFHLPPDHGPGIRRIAHAPRLARGGKSPRILAQRLYDPRRRLTTHPTWTAPGIRRIAHAPRLARGGNSPRILAQRQPAAIGKTCVQPQPIGPSDTMRPAARGRWQGMLAGGSPQTWSSRNPPARSLRTASGPSASPPAASGGCPGASEACGRPADTVSPAAARRTKQLSKSAHRASYRKARARQA